MVFAVLVSGCTPLALNRLDQLKTGCETDDLHACLQLGELSCVTGSGSYCQDISIFQTEMQLMCEAGNQPACEVLEIGPWPGANGYNPKANLEAATEQCAKKSSFFICLGLFDYQKTKDLSDDCKSGKIDKCFELQQLPIHRESLSQSAYLLHAINPGKASIVFVVPAGISNFMASYEISILEIKDDNVKDDALDMIGNLERNTFFVGEFNPGKHLFMSYRSVLIGNDTDFIYADLMPGRVYYVRYDGEKLNPVSIKDKSMGDLKNSIDSGIWIGSNSDGWTFKPEKSSDFWQRILSKYTENYLKWLQRPAAEKQHLAPEDGE
jgi:hypothetical protein